MEKLDCIKIVGVSAFGRHGVLEEERKNGQTFIVDAKLYLNLNLAGHSDDLSKTVNYAECATRIVQIIKQESPFYLIEALAESIAENLLSFFSQIDAVEIVVHKPKAPIPVPFSDVMVQIYRKR